MSHYQSSFPLGWVNIKGVELIVPENRDCPENKSSDT